MYKGCLCTKVPFEQNPKIKKMNCTNKKTNKTTDNRRSDEGMVVIIAVIFFLIISLTLMLAVTNPIAEQIRSSGRYLDAAQSYVTAENLNDDVLYRLNHGLAVPSSLSLSLNGATSTAVITDLGTTKQVATTGNDNNARRSIQSVVSQATGASFNYGLHTGNGGLSMTGGAHVDGNVYSNGDVVGSSGTYVTGSAYAANRSDPSLDQTNNSGGTPPYELDFGGQLTSFDQKPQDLAQSFKVSTTEQLTSLNLYIKKYSSGWSNDITVRIMSNSGSSPSNTTLVSATLLANAISTSYGDVAVSFPSPITLTAGTTYWLVLDTSNSWGNYFTLGASQNTYTNGVAKLGVRGGTWNAASPADLDGYFDIYLGGDTGKIEGITVGQNGGDAHAHLLDDVTISGSNKAYCQISSGNTNKPCDTSLPDPSPEAFPIVDSLIDQWKAEAAAGTQRGSWTIQSNTSTSTTGAMKINGDLDIKGGGTLTLGGTLYVTGAINLSGGGLLKLSTSLGNAASVIVVDGTTDLTGGAYISGNGYSGNYAILISTNTNCATSASCSDQAIKQSGGVGSVVLVAQKGGISFSGGASAKAAVANYMTLSGGTSLVYENGLANVNFSSGPGGTWSVNSWKEVAN